MVYVTFYFHFYCRIVDDQDMDLNTSLMSFDNLLDYYDTGIHGGIDSSCQVSLKKTKNVYIAVWNYTYDY